MLSRLCLVYLLTAYLSLCMKRRFEGEASDESEAQGKNARLEDAADEVEVKRSSLQTLPNEILSSHIFTRISPADILMVGMSSKTLTELSTKEHEKLVKEDLIGYVKALREENALARNSPRPLMLRSKFFRLFPNSQNILYKAVLLRMKVALLRKLDGSPAVIPPPTPTSRPFSPELVGASPYIDTLIHIPGYPQVTLAALSEQLFPKVYIDEAFIKEIPLDDVNLLNNAYAIIASEIIRDDYMDELKKLVRIRIPSVSRKFIDMLEQASVEPLLTRFEEGTPYLPRKVDITLFFQFVTDKELDRALNFLRADMNMVQVRDEHVLKSKLSSENVFKVFACAPTFTPLNDRAKFISNFLRSGRHKDKALLLRFLSYDPGMVASMEKALQEDVNFYDTHFEIAVIQDRDQAALKKIIASGTFQPRLSHIILAVRANLPHDLLLMMSKSVIVLPSFLRASDGPVDIPMDVLENLMSEKTTSELQHIIKEDFFAECLIKLTETHKLPKTILPSVVSSALNGIPSNIIVEKILRNGDLRPFFRSPIFGKSNFSHDVGYYIFFGRSLEKLLEYQDELDFIEDLSFQEFSTLGPYLLASILWTPGGVQALGRLGHSRLFDYVLRNNTFFQANLPRGFPTTPLRLMSPDVVVRLLQKSVVPPSFKTEIFLDHMVKNFEAYEGIDLFAELEPRQRSGLMRILSGFANNMTEDERLSFLRKNKLLSKCVFSQVIARVTASKPEEFGKLITLWTEDNNGHVPEERKLAFKEFTHQSIS